tara:strand:- start:45 stop:1391 length:1347 start_codon:yes stop_codon:yes gene_type:complete
MADFKIGTEFADGKFYAGPKYGFVEKQRYQELLKDGSLGRGEQTAQKLIESSVHTLSKIRDFIPTVEKQSNGGKRDRKSNGNGGYGQESIKSGLKLLRPAAETALKILDAPVTATHWLSKKVDPTGRGIGKTPLTMAEIALSLGGGAAKKGITTGGKKLLTKIDDVSDALKSTKQLAGATAGQVPTNGRLNIPKNGNGGNGVNGAHKPLQITVDPKYQEIGPGFTQRTDIQKYLKDQKLKIDKIKDPSLVNRIISTPPDQIDPSVLVYGRDKFKHALYDLHHMDPKGETGSIFKLMREIGDEEDVINLYAYMALRGVGGGDKMSNLLYMNKPAHWDIHKWRRNQPGLSGLKMEVGSDKLYKYLKETVDGDTNKLMKIVDEMIGDNFIVSRSKALEFQKNFVDKFKKNKLKLVLPKKNVKPIKRRSEKVSVDDLYNSIPDHYFEKGLRV